MTEASLAKLLDDVSAGRLPPGAALERLRTLPFEDLGFAKIDHHRPLRCGRPEVIFGRGKTPDQIAGAFASLAAKGGTVLATLCEPAAWDAVRAVCPAADWHPLARLIRFIPPDAPAPAGSVLVVAAGTADLPVAEEARLSAEAMGAAAELLADVGVAGLHRLLTHVGKLRQANAVIVVAGMEGALPSVVAGLTDRPVIAVPTSVGYGAAFGGVAALLGMLNSCAGLAVVNIDAGFTAAQIAASINRLAIARRDG